MYTMRSSSKSIRDNKNGYCNYCLLTIYIMELVLGVTGGGGGGGGGEGEGGTGFFVFMR